MLTTHYLDEAEALADRVGVIAGGKLYLRDQNLIYCYDLSAAGRGCTRDICGTSQP